MALPDCERKHQRDIFVSYSTHDQEWVHPFHYDLVKAINRPGQRDIVSYLDRLCLAPGFTWDEALKGAVQDFAPNKRHEGTEKKVAHLGMIQGVINRMATKFVPGQGLERSHTVRPLRTCVEGGAPGACLHHIPASNRILAP